MTKYPNKCVDCGSPCGYTGLMNSADCSNTSCKNADPALIPASAISSPNVVLGGMATGRLHLLKSAGVSVRPFVSPNSAPTPTLQITSLVPKIAAKGRDLRQKADRFDFLSWVLGNTGFDWKYGTDLSVGWWDETTYGRPPAPGDAQCGAISGVSRGVPGWLDTDLGVTYSIENRNDIDLWNTETLAIKITHISLGYLEKTPSPYFVTQLSQKLVTPIIVGPLSYVRFQPGTFKFTLS